MVADCIKALAALATRWQGNQQENQERTDTEQPVRSPPTCNRREQPAAERQPAPRTQRIYLRVSYAQARAELPTSPHGGYELRRRPLRWDPNRKRWYSWGGAPDLGRLQAKYASA